MYDSVSLWLDEGSARSVDLLAEVSSNLKKVQEVQRDGVLSCHGYLDNLKIKVFKTGISVKGSPAKYYLGDNFQTMTRKDTEFFIEKLSDELNVNMSISRVRRVDIAQTHITDYPPETYFPYLGESQYFNRLLQPHSLYYQNGHRTKLFYNKIIEGKKKGLEIPEVWEGCNALRYEYRLTSRAPKYLGKADLCLCDLAQEELYINFIDQYVEEFENISKVNKVRFDMTQISSPKDFKNLLYVQKLQEIGMEETMEIIEEMRANNVFDKPEYYSRLKAEIKGMCKESKFVESNSLLEELTKKVKSVKESYR